MFSVEKKGGFRSAPGSKGIGLLKGAARSRSKAGPRATEGLSQVDSQLLFAVCNPLGPAGLVGSEIRTS